MVKRYGLWLVGILLLFMNCQVNHYYGIYRNSYFETWDFYEKDGVDYMTHYTYRIYNNETFVVTKEKESQSKTILHLTNDHNDRLRFVLSREKRAWILERLYVNGEVASRYKKYRGRISPEKTALLKKESEVMSKIAVSDKGCHYSAAQKLYWIDPCYPKINLYEYFYDQNYKITDWSQGKIFLHNNEVLYQLKGRKGKYQDLRNKTYLWGYESYKPLDPGSSVVSLVYQFDRYEVIKDLGLTEKMLKNLTGSEILISRFKNLLIDAESKKILDIIPRHGGGFSGEDCIEIKTKIDQNDPPREICLHIYKNLSVPIDFMAGIFELKEDLSLNIYYQLKR